MDELTIVIRPSSEGGYLYDIYKGDWLDEDAPQDADEGGICTTTMLNALGMAVSQATELITHEKGDECPGCGDDMTKAGKSEGHFGEDICPACYTREVTEGDFIGER